MSNIEKLEEIIEYINDQNLWESKCSNHNSLINKTLNIIDTSESLYEIHELLLKLSILHPTPKPLTLESFFFGCYSKPNSKNKYNSSICSHSLPFFLDKLQLDPDTKVIYPNYKSDTEPHVYFKTRIFYFTENVNFDNYDFNIYNSDYIEIYDYNNKLIFNGKPRDFFSIKEISSNFNTSRLDTKSRYNNFYLAYKRQIYIFRILVLLAILTIIIELF